MPTIFFLSGLLFCILGMFFWMSSDRQPNEGESTAKQEQMKKDFLDAIRMIKDGNALGADEIIKKYPDLSPWREGLRNELQTIRWNMQLEFFKSLNNLDFQSAMKYKYFMSEQEYTLVYALLSFFQGEEIIELNPSDTVQSSDYAKKDGGEWVFVNNSACFGKTVSQNLANNRGWTFGRKQSQNKDHAKKIAEIALQTITEYDNWKKCQGWSAKHFSKV